MSIRDWMMDKMPAHLGPTTAVGAAGMVVERPGLPPGVVYCPDPSRLPLTPDDVDEALDAMPDLQFLAVVRRNVASAAHVHGDARAVAVGSFALLKKALESDLTDISDFRSQERTYVERKFAVSLKFRRFDRVGDMAYEVTPSHGPSFVIVVIERYELTSEAVYQLLEEYADLPVEVIVTSNPSCLGFSPGTLASVASTGRRIERLNDLVR